MDGLLTRQQTLDLLKEYESNPQKNTIEILAGKYKMDVTTMKNILENYGTGRQIRSNPAYWDEI